MDSIVWESETDLLHLHKQILWILQILLQYNYVLDDLEYSNYLVNRHCQSIMYTAY